MIGSLQTTYVRKFFRTYLLIATICRNSSEAIHVTFHLQGQLSGQTISLCGQCLDRPDNATCETAVIIKNQTACPVTNDISCVFGWWWEMVSTDGNVTRDLQQNEFRLLDTRGITSNISIYSQLHQYGYEGVIQGHRLIKFNLRGFSGSEPFVAVCGQCHPNQGLYHVWGDDCAKWNSVPVKKNSAQVQIMLRSNCTKFQWKWAAVKASPTSDPLRYELHGSQNRESALMACNGTVLVITDNWDARTISEDQKCSSSNTSISTAVTECSWSVQNLNRSTPGEIIQTSTAGKTTSLSPAGETTQTSTAGETTQTSTAGETTQTSTAGEFTQTSTAGETTQTSTAGETTQTSTAGETTQTSTAGETTQTSTAGETTQTSTAGETTQTSTAGETTQTSTAGETTQTSTAGETTQTSTAGEATQTSTAGETTQTSTSGEFTLLSTAGKTTSLSTSGKTTLWSTAADTTLLSTAGETTLLSTASKTTLLSIAGQSMPLSTSDETTLLSTAGDTTPRLPTAGVITLLPTATGDITLISIGASKMKEMITTVTTRSSMSQTLTMRAIESSSRHTGIQQMSSHPERKLMENITASLNSHKAQQTPLTVAHISLIAAGAAAALVALTATIVFLIRRKRPLGKSLDELEPYIPLDER